MDSVDLVCVYVLYFHGYYKRQTLTTNEFKNPFASFPGS